MRDVLATVRGSADQGLLSGTYYQGLLSPSFAYKNIGLGV